jgi:RND family efflux transporter MFP subunit
MKTNHPAALLAAPALALLSACSPPTPPAEAPRPVRTVELRYDGFREASRYVGTILSRHEVDQAFRVGGKVAQRRVEVGHVVRQGDILAVLDDVDYRLAEEASHQALVAATTQARQAESDRQRLTSLQAEGSVSVADEEHANSAAERAQAAAEAETRRLELARNRLKYTVLRASQSGVVTQVRFEVGQVVAEGQPIVSIANQGEPEVVIDVPEDGLASIKAAKFKASLASAPDETFDVALRELAPQAAAQTRTYRARLKPVKARPLPLGATATVTVERNGSSAQVAAVPATALTQSGGKPAVWVVRAAGETGTGTVELVEVSVQGYRSDQVLVSGPSAGAHVVIAGVQKMSPDLRVALSGDAMNNAIQQAAQ